MVNDGGTQFSSNNWVVDPLTVEQDGRSLSSDFRQGQLSLSYTF